MPDPGEASFIPEQRRRDPDEVPRVDVERAITAALHRQCGAAPDEADIAVTDLEAHAADARHVLAELRERGWKVVRA